MKLSALLDFNPRTPIPKGTVAPFVDMASLPTGERYFPISTTKEFKGSGSKFKDGDTLLARITPCLENGKGGFVKGLGEDVAAHGSTEFIVLRAKKPTDENFVFYVSKHPDFRDYAIQQMSGTSGRQRVAWQSLADYEIHDLSEDEREEIGKTLSALDDKIALNRRMNETLEGLARALFKDWFVDFGPTRAKASGAKPDLPPETLSLFPDRLDENGLPEGWEEQTIGDNFDVTMGQSPPGSTYNEDGEGLPFFQGRRDFEFRFPSRRVFCTKPSRIASKDWTLLSVRAPVGDINRAWEECAIGRGVAAFMHKSGYASLTYYVGLHLREQLASYDSEGTVFGSINQKQFKALNALTASPQTMKAFEAIVAPLDKIIRNNTAESRTLAQTRDLLLPKLMSGEIRVREAEGIVEGVV